MTGDREQPGEDFAQGAVWLVGGLLVAAAYCWIVPAVVVLVHAQEAVRLSLPDAAASFGRLASRASLGDPASAYPGAARAQMPTAAAWWSIAGVLHVAAGWIVLALVRRVEPVIARERLGRRPYDWRGARPRPWARPRDLRRRRRAPAGFSLGRVDGRTVAADEESHVVVIAPTRAGKTTRCIVPWLLEHRGPAIVTSTKRDVLDASHASRSQTGRIWIFDPFSEDTCAWSPTFGCEDWSSALRQAQWLADASSDGDSEIARYWRGEAAKLLAPLLHAAALEGSAMTEVLHWLDAQDVKKPTTILAGQGASAAVRQLHAVASLDPRNRGTTYMSAGSVLSAYRYPEVSRPADSVLTAERFVLSAGDTLFLVAAERHQRLLAPLMASLLSSIIHAAVELSLGERRLRILLDEAANIAPLAELPRMLSQGAGHGIRIATVWQSLAQMRERHGHGTETILANSTAKIFMGSITDEATRSYLQSLLGTEERDDERVTKATSAALQQLTGDRALILSGPRLPAIAALRPHWK
ncbi:MAG: type IV secretory system conjugative DNA transfer family protein [Solirubrobacterales bacterium]|nr:type IV secretory system conjugative DNA transfer family protein [Solirubrobacterales bacterium]